MHQKLKKVLMMALVANYLSVNSSERRGERINDSIIDPSLIRFFNRDHAEIRLTIHSHKQNLFELEEPAENGKFTIGKPKPMVDTELLPQWPEDKNLSLNKILTLQGPRFIHLNDGRR